jgi:uncharacterized membrane protein SpoIIM required for sporulation
MSLEILFKPSKVIKNNYILFALCFFSVSIALLLSLRIFREHSSFLIIVFTIIPLIPFLIKIIEREEKLFEKKKKIFKHSIIKVYMLMFLFLSISFSLWYIILPNNLSKDLFKTQIDTLGEELNIPCYDFETDLEYEKCLLADFTHDGKNEKIIWLEGKKPDLINVNGKYYNYKTWIYFHYLQNNLIILLFIFLTSLIFGAGAIFSITWNASIIGIYLAKSIEGNFIYSIYSFFKALLLLIPHGLFEISGFILGALAGGILSVAMVRKIVDKDYGKLNVILKDTAILMTLAIVCIIIAALIEVLI